MNHHQYRVNKNKGGFSLLETLLVVTIMSFLISISIPALNSFFKRIQLHHTLRTITCGLNYARYHAIWRNKSIKFVMEGTDFQKILFLKEKKGKIWKTFKQFDLGKNISVESRSSPVFTPYGNASPLCSIIVSNHISQYKITLSIGGRIKVVKI